MLLDERTRNIVGVTEPLAHKRWAEQPPDTIPTPFAAWTAACRDEGGGQGIALGWYVVIGGDTKQGKTLMALQCMTTALSAGRRVGFLNLEMSLPQLRLRVYSQLTGVPPYRLEPGPSFSAQDAEFVDQWISEKRETGTMHFLVNEEPHLPLPSMLALMEEWRAEYGCQVFCVDYMQLVEAQNEDGIAGETRTISKALRQFAHSNHCVVFAVSQFNNEGGNDSDRKPHAGSLYGGRRIAQDSNQTLLLDHSRIERIPNSSRTRTWLLMPYNRHGPPVEIPIEWDWSKLTARAALPDEEAQWPGHP